MNKGRPGWNSERIVPELGQLTCIECQTPDLGLGSLAVATMRSLMGTDVIRGLMSAGCKANSVERVAMPVAPPRPRGTV